MVRESGNQNLADSNEDLFHTPSVWALNIFWIGYFVYIIAFVASMTTLVNYTVCQGLQILGMLMFLAASVFTLKWRHDNQYLTKVFIIYMIWMVITAVRGFSFDYQFIKLILFMPNGGIFLYLAPLAIMLPVTPKALKKVFNLAILLGFAYGVICVIFYQIVIYGALGSRVSTGIFEVFTHFMGIPAAFIFITFLYHKKKVNIFALGVIALAFVLSVIRARRGLMLMNVTLFLSSYILFLKYSKVSKTLNIALSVVMISMIGLYAYMVFINNRGGLFGLVVSRIDEDTRTGVEQAFYASMDLKGWIFGRGINGQYYCPGIDEGHITVYRSVIETGYLQVILNGGLISLVLYLMMMVPALIKGLFRSNNLLCKACGTWILLFIFYTYPTTIHAFSLSYLILWMAVSICFNDNIRNLTDDELMEQFIGK